MAKIKAVMNLLIQKIQMKDAADWYAAELDNIEPGLYLCENPDGGMFFMSKAPDGARFGFFLPISEIGRIYAIEAEQKILEQIKPILENGFGRIENKLKPIETTTNNSDCILNEMDESLNVKLVKIEECLGNLKTIVAELPKHSEQQRSTLSEMSDAVVNIIKATK